MQSVGIATTEPVSDTSWGKVSRNPNTVSAILAMVKAGKTQTEVANAFGITQSAVSKVIDKYTPRDDLAKLRAQALSLAVIESLARSQVNGEETGKHGAGAALLNAAGLIGGDRDRGGGVKVEIGVRDSDVQVQVNAIDTYQTQKISECVTTQLLAASPLDGFARESGERSLDDQAKGRTGDDAL